MFFDFFYPVLSTQAPGSSVLSSLILYSVCGLKQLGDGAEPPGRVLQFWSGNFSPKTGFWKWIGPDFGLKCMRSDRFISKWSKFPRTGWWCWYPSENTLTKPAKNQRSSLVFRTAGKTISNGPPRRWRASGNELEILLLSYHKGSCHNNSCGGLCNRGWRMLMNWSKNHGDKRLILGGVFPSVSRFHRT